MTITLIIAYRNRQEYLDQLLSHLSSNHFNDAIELVIVEGDGSPTLKDHVSSLPNVRYKHIEMLGPFHKTKLLNEGLRMATGQYVIPYDVDLLPLNDAISVGLDIARKAPNVLVSGYRLMSQTSYYDGDISKLEGGFRRQSFGAKKANDNQ